MRWVGLAAVTVTVVVPLSPVDWPAVAGAAWVVSVVCAGAVVCAAAAPASNRVASTLRLAVARMVREWFDMSVRPLRKHRPERAPHAPDRFR